MTADHGGKGSMVVSHPMAKLTQNNEIQQSSLTIDKYSNENGTHNNNESKLSLNTQ